VPFKGNILGPLIFVAVPQAHQTAGTSVVQMLTQQISRMTICSVPGEDVVVLCNQVYKLCNRIKGLGNPPDDLANMVSKCFLQSSNLTFNIHASKWHSKANKKTAEWQDVLEELKTVYKSLAQSGEWDATNVKTPDAVMALKAEISALCQN